MSVWRRILAGEAEHLEAYLLALTFGKPKETVDLNIHSLADEFRDMSLDELQKELDGVQRQLDDAKALKAALPAEVLSELLPECLQDDQHSADIDVSTPSPASDTCVQVADAQQSAGRSEEPAC